MAPREAIKDALDSLQHLISEYKSFIVQATIGTSNRKGGLSSSLVSAKYTLHDFSVLLFSGTNLNSKYSEYSHAAVIRFPSRKLLIFFLPLQLLLINVVYFCS